jgi:hypothetical protein
MQRCRRDRAHRGGIASVGPARSHFPRPQEAPAHGYREPSSGVRMPYISAYASRFLLDACLLPIAFARGSVAAGPLIPCSPIHALQVVKIAHQLLLGIPSHGQQTRVQDRQTSCAQIHASFGCSVIITQQLSKFAVTVWLHPN